MTVPHDSGPHDSGPHDSGPQHPGPRDSGAQDDSGPVRLTAYADGRVQGVGFRAWVRMKATSLGLTGTATNLDDGRVEIIAEGPARDVRALLAELTGGEAPGRVTRVTQRWGHPQGRLRGFSEG